MEKENKPHGRTAEGDTTVRGAPMLVERSHTLVGQDRRGQLWKWKGELERVIN